MLKFVNGWVHIRKGCLYIDLPHFLLHSQSRMLADDTGLTFSDNDITKFERNLNEDLADIREWLVINRLTLNMHV